MNCSLQFHFFFLLANNFTYEMTMQDWMTIVVACGPPAPSIGAAVLLLLPLLVILHHVQQIDVSTNQPETGMTLLM